MLINIFRMLAIRPEEQAIYRATCARLYSQINQPEGVGRLVPLTAADWMQIASLPVEGLATYFPAAFCADFNSFRALPMTELMEKMVQLFGLGAEKNGNHIPFLLALRDQVAVFAAGATRV